ncbi:MAG: hypothetical protein JKY42_08655 [Flavobacteriales bacterium]|nr:hypothetical protein [Flavobacteriales bacterium]
MISVYEIPVANFTSAPNPTDVLNTQIQFTNISDGNIYNWDWTFYYKDSLNVLENSSINNPLINFPSEPGSYPVNLEVETFRDCKNDTTLFFYNKWCAKILYSECI